MPACSLDASGSFLSLSFGLRSWSFVRNYCYRGLGFVFAFNFLTNQSCPLGAGAMLCVMGNSSVMRARVRSWTYPVDHASHLAFIPVSLGYQPGYWWYCVFSPKCLHPVNLWHLRTWIGRQEQRLPCEPARHPASHLKPRCRPITSLGFFVRSNQWVGGCVYSKWGWELLKSIGRKLRAEGCVRMEKDQPHPRLWPSPLPMSPQPKELVWWPLDAWWTRPPAPRAPTIVAAPVPGTNGLPILPFGSSSRSGMPPHQPTQLSSPECWPPYLRSSAQDEMSLLSLYPQPLALAHLNSKRQCPWV